jgi:protein required for attachment to host cells
MIRTCILVADAARARIYTLERSIEPNGMQEQFREERDLVDPARRERSGEQSSDTFMFDDHRQSHLDVLDTRFARELVSEIATIVRDRACRKLIVIASSRMIGDLRTYLAPLGKTGLAIEEVIHDYTKLTTSALRDRLAELGMVPARERVVFAGH